VDVKVANASQLAEQRHSFGIDELFGVVEEEAVKFDGEAGKTIGIGGKGGAQGAPVPAATMFGQGLPGWQFSQFLHSVLLWGANHQSS